MNKEQFENEYAKNSGVTVAQLKELGLSGFPCDCGEDICKGWKMEMQSTTRSDLLVGLIEDVLEGKFGTKNRAELLLRLEGLKIK